MMRIPRLFRPRASTKTALTCCSLNSMFRGMYSTDTFEELSHEQKTLAIRNSSMIAICVNRITVPFSDPPWQAGRMVGGEFEAVPWEQTPFPQYASLTEQMNSQMSYRTWAQNALQYLLLNGIFFQEKDFDSAGDISALYPLPPYTVSPMRNSKTGQVTSYQVTDQYSMGQSRSVQPFRMSIEYSPDPHDVKCPISPLDMAIRDKSIDDKRTNYTAEMLTNMRLPGSVLVSKNRLDPDVRKNIEKKWDQKLLGRSGATTVIDGSDIELITKPPLSDLDWHGLANLQESRICAIFGVPPTIAHVRVGLENAPYSKIDSAIQIFFRETLVPTWITFQEYLTKVLIREPYPDLEDWVIRYDLSDVKQLAEDAVESAGRANTLFTGGIATLNEARKIAGLVDLGPSGDVRRVPMGTQELATNQEPAAVTASLGQHYGGNDEG